MVLGLGLDWLALEPLSGTACRVRDDDPLGEAEADIGISSDIGVAPLEVDDLVDLSSPRSNDLFAGDS